MPIWSKRFWIPSLARMRHNRPMLKTILKNCIFASLLCISAAAMAEDTPPEQPRWFQVELIFFEPVRSAATGEVWPVPKPAAAGRLVTELSPPAGARQGQEPTAFQLLAPSNFALGELSRKLLNSRQYRVLTHIAWRQPTVELANSTAVHVHNELMQEGSMVAASKKPLVLNNLPDPIERSGEALKIKRFDGTVTVSLSRFLHLKTDITYYNPEVYIGEQIAQKNVDAPNIEYFKLEDSRRMRSKEIHYIDHPYFGIIAMITPYEAK